MAVTSSSGSTTNKGSVLDVSSIVSGLMEAENVPVTKLDARISTSTVKITALGQIKSSLSALKAALVDLQTPANFSKQSVSVDSSAVATAQANSSAVAGSYQLEVTSLAKTSIRNVTGFTSSKLALDWYSDSGNTDLKNKATATVLKVSEGHYILSLMSKDNVSDTEFTNSVTEAVDFPYASTNADIVQEGQNATFTLNDVAFTRSTNSVSDVIPGVTLHLTGTNESLPTTLSVTADTVPVRPKLDALVKAYNDLYSIYKQQTASSTDSATRGVLNSDFSVSTMMRQLTTGLIEPLSDGYGVTFSEFTDLAALGLKLNDAGTLSVDETLLSTAGTTLQLRLKEGIRIGYNHSTFSDLSNQISEMLISGGLIQNRIDSEQTTKKDLDKRKTDLQAKLVQVQARYTAQYAALDSLLFKLQSTSDSLKSALDGLTNSQKTG